MQDIRRQFTADDLTDAYWRGYYDARSNRAPKPRRKTPRGVWLILAILVSLAMWGLIVGAFMLLLI